MITIEVDKKTCVGDGKCVEICPMHILRMGEEERVPEFIPLGSEACINCSQCFAFCPKSSIKLSTIVIAGYRCVILPKLPGSD
jgi:formate hydrogenlyase subunit 6/NADH:ubiquinone oxidoreductase subunit I